MAPVEHRSAHGLGIAAKRMQVERDIVIIKAMEIDSTAPKRFFGPDYYGEQDENGIDLSLIRENLKLTPLERIRKANAARRQALRLQEYGRRHRGNTV